MKKLKGIDFGSYEALQQMMNDPNFNFKTVTRLDFSNNTHTDTPPEKALQLLIKLSVLILNKNKISRFNVSGFINGAPFLQELDLSYNDINVLDDIIELGTLKQLRVLNIKENPIVKKFLRVKLIEALIFPSKYKSYNAVKVLTASYNSIPNKAKLDPKSEEETKKFKRLLERGEEEFEIEGKFSRLCKYDHKSTLIKLSQQTCPVPRKTRFPMLTMLNEEIISIQEMQSILMTEDLSEILVKNDLNNGSQTERVVRKNEGLHQEYLLRYTKKKEMRKEIEEDKDRARRDADRGNGQSEQVETMRDLMGAYGVKGKVDYQDELWRKPLDLKYKNAEYNIGISEFKTMVKEYKELKEQEREDSEKRKKEARKQRREKAAKRKGVEHVQIDDSDEDGARPGDKEVEKLLRKKTVKQGKPKLNLEMKYSVEQGSSDTDIDECQDEDEKEEWSEGDFDAEENVDGFDEGGLSKNASQQEGKRLSRQMTLLRMSLMKDKEEKFSHNELTIEDPTKDFILEESSFGLKSGTNAKVENVSLVLSLDPREGQEVKKGVPMTPTLARRGRKFFVVHESEPNMSLMAYGKSTERSVGALEQGRKVYGRKEEGLKTYFEGKTSKPRKSVRLDTDLNLLGAPNDNKEETTIQFTRRTDQFPPTEGTENQTERYETTQPDQNPDSGIKIAEDTTNNKAAKALINIMKDTSASNPHQGTLFQQATYKRAMDIILPPDTTRSFEQQVSNRSFNASYSLNRHIQVFKNNNTSRDYSRTSRNQGLSFRAFATKTTEDTSLPPTKDEYQLTEPRETSKVPLTMSRGDSMEKTPVKRKGYNVWAHQRGRYNTPNSARTFKITSASSSKSPIRQQPLGLTRQDIAIQPQVVQQQISPKGSSIVIGSMSIVHSPKTVRYLDDNEANQHAGDSSPNRRNLDRSKTKEVRSPKAGKIRIESPNNIVIQDGVKSTVVKPRRTQVEDLIPGPEDGIPEGVKLKLLNSRGPLYMKLLDTAKMLDETENIIKEANDLGDKVLANHLKKPKMDTVDPRILGYSQLTQFLRDFYKGKNLTFLDDKDVRELGELVNEYSKIEDSAMNKLDVEVKLRTLKMEALELEGAELEKKYVEIERYVRYLELLENLEKYKDNQRNSSKMDKLIDIDIKKAEHNAILATHYMKLQKYCDPDYLFGLMEDDLKLVNKMNAQRVKTARADLRGGSGSEKTKEKAQDKKTKGAKGEDKAGKKKSEELEKKPESLSQYIKRVKDDKNKALQAYPYQRKEPVFTDDKMQWLNVTLVSKFEPKPMLKVEDMMELQRRKMIAEYQKKNPSTLSAAEKTIRHAEEFKEGAKLKKVLKAKMDKYIAEGTKELDKLLENENVEISARYDQKKMFGEYMDLLWRKKL